MTEQVIEPEIEHLDFDPDKDVKVEEKKEPPKTCTLRRGHPNDPTLYTCGRPAVYFVTVNQPCGHTKQVYLCQGCWIEVENGREWQHGQGPDRRCKKDYVAKKHIVRWERIK